MRVVLLEPDSAIRHWLTLPAFAPIRKEAIEAYQKTRAPGVPVLAAYQVEAYVRDQSLQLKKNPHYYGVTKDSLDRIIIRFIKDEAAILPLLKSKKIDVATTVSDLQVEDMKKVAHVKSFPVEATTYLAFNCKKAPFHRVEYRRQVREALKNEKKELADLLMSDDLPADHLIPPPLWPAPLSKVKIEHGGTPSSSVGFSEEISIQSNAGSKYQTILEFVQSRLKKKLSWKVKLNLLDWKAHYSKLKSDPDPIFRFGWQNPVGSLYAFYRLFASDSPNNLTGWKNAEYDELVHRLKQETRMVKKLNIVEKLEKILSVEVPAIPLLHHVHRYGISKRVQGFRANPFGVILFRELRLLKTLN